MVCLLIGLIDLISDNTVNIFLLKILCDDEIDFYLISDAHLPMYFDTFVIHLSADVLPRMQRHLSSIQCKEIKKISRENK